MANLHNFFVICSDDPLLMLDRTQELMKIARERFADADFLLYTQTDFGAGSTNLKALETEISDFGLFGGERIIKINFSSFEGIAVEVLQLLTYYYSLNPERFFIIIELPRIKTTYTQGAAKDIQEKRNELFNTQSSTPRGKGKGKSKGSIETRKKDTMAYIKGVSGVVEHLYPPLENQVASWVKERAAQRYQLEINPDALDLIVRSCDNNLLTIDSSLKLMQLMLPQGTLDLHLVETYFLQDARYTGLELPEAILSYDSERALNIINSFCNGAGSSISTGLTLLIARLDTALQIIYQARAENLHTAKGLLDNKLKDFFRKNFIMLSTTQEIYLKAIKNMPADLLDFLTQTLSEATISFSHFDHEGALRALQRMAVAVKTPQVKYLGARYSLSS